VLERVILTEKDSVRALFFRIPVPMFQEPDVRRNRSSKEVGGPKSPMREATSSLLYNARPVPLGQSNPGPVHAQSRVKVRRGDKQKTLRRMVAVLTLEEDIRATVQGNLPFVACFPTKYRQDVKRER
jgi:hypothetical protein